MHKLHFTTKIGDNRVSNTQPGSLATSGFATGSKQKTGSAKEKVPDEGLVTTKPKSPQQSQECATVPSGVQVNAFGLRSDIAPHITTICRFSKC